jgi:hypothetical protein
MKISEKFTWSTIVSLAKYPRVSLQLWLLICKDLSMRSLTYLCICRNFADNNFGGCIPDFYANIVVNFSGNAIFCSQVLPLLPASSLIPSIWPTFIINYTLFPLFLPFILGIHPLLPLYCTAWMPYATTPQYGGAFPFLSRLYLFELYCVSNYMRIL